MGSRRRLWDPEQVVVDRTTALVRTIVATGQALGPGVVAECVETEQADELRSMGCTNARGRPYAPALPTETAGTVLGTTLTEHESIPVARHRAGGTAANP